MRDIPNIPKRLLLMSVFGGAAMAIMSIAYRDEGRSYEIPAPKRSVSYEEPRNFEFEWRVSDPVTGRIDAQSEGFDPVSHESMMKIGDLEIRSTDFDSTSQPAENRVYDNNYKY